MSASAIFFSALVGKPTENEPMLGEKSPMPTRLNETLNFPRQSGITSTWDPRIAWCRPSKLSRLQVLTERCRLMIRFGAPFASEPGFDDFCRHRLIVCVEPDRKRHREISCRPFHAVLHVEFTVDLDSGGNRELAD